MYIDLKNSYADKVIKLKWKHKIFENSNIFLVGNSVKIGYKNLSTFIWCR